MNKIIAANWKMNKNSKEAAETIKELSALLNNSLPPKREVIIFVFYKLGGEHPCPFLLRSAIRGARRISRQGRRFYR